MISPIDIVWRLLKRQTELGEFHPELPSSHGPVVYYHGTARENMPSIQQHGLRSGWDPEGERAPRGGGYSGVYASVSPKVRSFYGMKDTLYSNGGLVGIRQGAGSPEPYFGYDNDEQDRHFPNHWRFGQAVPPKYLVNINRMPKRFMPKRLKEGSEHIAGTPQAMHSGHWEEYAPTDEKPDNFALPDFYDEAGNPPEVGELDDFDKDAWAKKWGRQNE